jgi:CRP-like cAMP-binding protein
MVSKAPDYHPEGLRAWLGNDEELLAAWKSVDVGVDEVVFHVGEVAPGLYFVETGCLRIFCLHEAKDVTVHFYAEGDKVTSLNSFRLGVPSPYGLEAVETSRLWKITKKAFDRLCAVKPAMESILEAFVSDRCELNGQRVMILLSETPEDRYLRFEREHPDLLGRIKQHLLASYLGITPVSLSRLRARLVRKARTSSPI